ncbi:hypothetical protein QJQ45_018346 [Haematococcus lacustris]|nr:hypothetical protein QJQ45_018346 [Haematococcus lacustris]
MKKPLLPTGTQLLDLPDELLGAVLRQLRDRESRLHVFKASKRLAIALLQHTPAIELRYPLGAIGDEDDEENGTCLTAFEYSTQRPAPFLAHALLARKAPLQLSLQPAEGLLIKMEEIHEAGDDLVAVQAVAAKLAYDTLDALELCPAVTHLAVEFSELMGSFWQPGHTAALAAAYPSLTSLTLGDLEMTFTQLSQLVCHPALLSQLRRLDISDLTMCGWDASTEGEPGSSPFTGLRLQQLSLGYGDWDYEPHLAPLAPHLTQLEVWYGEVESLAAALWSFTNLQHLHLWRGGTEASLRAVLSALAQLPSLNTLELPEFDVGQEALDQLLALTQVTFLRVRCFRDIALSRATAACSWRQLKLYDRSVLDWVTAAHLPLHSLTHPLQVFQLGGTEEVGVEVLAAAELNLCERNKAGLEVEDMPLSLAGVELLTELYLSHCHLASSTDSEPSTSTSLPSTCPEGHMRAWEAGSSRGLGVQQGAAAGGQALLQCLGPSINKVTITLPISTDLVNLGRPVLSPASLHALAALSTKTGVAFKLQHTNEDSEEDEGCLTALKCSTQRLAPFLTHALLTRKAALKFSLQPAKGLLTRLEDCYEADEDSEAVHAVAAKLASNTLGALELCPAVTHLTVKFSELFGSFWQPGHTAALAAAYPSLTSLTLKGLRTTFAQLSQLSQLQRLDLRDSTICHGNDSEAREPGSSPFTGSRLQQLSLGYGDWDYEPHLAPLAPHLTQLEVWCGELESLAAAVHSLTNLQHLRLTMKGTDASLRLLLSALAQLPSLHTLELPETDVGQEALDQLLALTQVTFLCVRRFKDIALSRTTPACSWRRLELGVWGLDWVTAAHLPLHSLTHPLQVSQLGGSVEVGVEVLAAAELNLCERNKAGLEVEDMPLSLAGVELLTELYLSHCHLASSSHSGPSTSTSLPSGSSPEGHITPGEAGSGRGLGGQQGPAAGGQALMQRLGPYVNKVTITLPVSAGYLLDLPDVLLCAVLRQLRDRESRLHVFRTNKRLAIALLQHTPAIELRYPLGAIGDEDDEENGTCPTAFEYSTQRLAPFLTHALLARKAALQLSLQPAARLLIKWEDCIAAGDVSMAVDAVAAKLAYDTLGALELCPAVTHLTIKFSELFGCFWQPGHTAALAAAYPSLTSLTLKGLRMTFTQLSQLVSHPPLLSQLQRLDITYLRMCNDSEAGEPGNSPFIGSRLKQLSLGVGYWGNWPHLAPLAPHLTQLAAVGLEPESLAAALHSLTNLQHLWLCMDGKEASLRVVLPALSQLPSLHILELPRNDVGQAALDQLLALTQVTFLGVHRFKDIALSRATAACSWRWLELCQGGWELDWVTAAHLPLHSLTHPLQVSQLGGSVEVGVEVLAAAELNLCERNKAGLEVEDMPLSRATVDLLTELYLSHCHLPSSSSSEGHMPAGQAGSSRGLGVQHGAAAGGKALMQRLGPYVNKVTITLPVSAGYVNFGRPVLGGTGEKRRIATFLAQALLARQAQLHLTLQPEGQLLAQPVEEAGRVLSSTLGAVEP